MIHRRLVTRRNKPTTPDEAFNLFAELSRKMPTTNDADTSLAQVRRVYLESIKHLLDYHAKHTSDLRRENADLRLLLDDGIASHTRADRSMGLLSRLRFVLGYGMR